MHEYAGRTKACLILSKITVYTSHVLRPPGIMNTNIQRSFHQYFPLRSLTQGHLLNVVKRPIVKAGVPSHVLPSLCRCNVVVQFHPWINFNSALSYAHYCILPYIRTTDVMFQIKMNLRSKQFQTSLILTFLCSTIIITRERN